MPPSSNIDSTKAFIKMLLNSFENFSPNNPVLTTDGDYVIYYADWSGVFKNDLMGIKATGKPVTFKDCDIFKLNDEGKITEHSSIQNMGLLLMTTK
jgi:predicted ester cyclase